MKNYFKKTPTSQDKEQAHLDSLLDARRAWERKLIDNRMAVRRAEAELGESLTALEAIEQAINKASDRVTAMKIDYDTVGTMELTAAISPVKYTEDEINRMANMSEVLKAQREGV